jgi:hypothetical protein
MSSTKHLKIKNTGILFELLTRQITADVLNDKKNSIAIKTLKKYFNEASELGKELELYNVLMNEKFSSEKQAEKLIEAVVKSRQRLSNRKLKLEKYELIKDIKESYDIVNFFSSRIPNYKVFASVYKLFDYTANQHRNDPTDEVRNKYAIVEHIINKRIDSSVKTNKIIETYKKQEKDLRLLTYSMLVDKFNNKYTDLNEQQKVLLQKYIQNISNTNSLREFINDEIKKLNSELKGKLKFIDDKVTVIKLKEAVKLTKNLTNHRIVKDKDVVNLMRYYELFEEITNVTSRK